jgi:hypothetical protein
MIGNTNFRRTEEYITRGVYLPPTRNINEADSDLQPPDKTKRDFMEEDASLNINHLIQAARIEQSPLNSDQSSSALMKQKMLQPDFCNEKRGFTKTLAPEGFGVF